MKNRVIIVTGVSGSGKSTIGLALANATGASFYDGDAFHPAANKAKMSAGIPLNDDDRLPWLSAINEHIRTKLSSETLVVACSALKEKYRKLLSASIDPASVVWVHLQGSYDLLYQRLTERKGHFMSASLLHSQFDTYEEPGSGIKIDVSQNIDQIIKAIMLNIDVERSDVGLIGLGVMGTSLARNIAGKGFTVSIYNRHVDGKEEGVARKMAAQYPELRMSKPFDDLGAFVASLHKPRKIILMVNAGKPVDDVLEKILPLLDAGDVIVDGGNSHYKDSLARQKFLEGHGMYFVGAGVSGGEEGALTGPSIMPGGSKKGFDAVKDILWAIAAKNERNEVCCDYIGDGGAGHFVKMVHNGIEYAEMQLIAEIYSHLRYDQKMDPSEIAALFSEWNKGEAASYLLGITADILLVKDEDGSPLIDKISDEAGNKGTGSWTTITACELGVPMPAMAEALFSRYLSSFKEDRLTYAALYPQQGVSTAISQEDLLKTYMFCRVMNHYQGFKLIVEASEAHAWNIDTSVLLMIWSGGCIIRSTLLSLLREGWVEHKADIMRHPYTRELILAHLTEIKETIARLTLSAQAYPVISSCLDYYKCLVSPRSSAYLIQAQRDYFGAHTYKRNDDPSGISHHTKWV